MNDEFLSEQEIGERFPGEWVLVEDLELDAQLRWMRGVVVAHDPIKNTVEALAQSRQSARSARPFTIQFFGAFPDATYLLAGRPLR